MFQNYPNPFNSETIIRYNTISNDDQQVILNVYDILGNLVKVLVNTKNTIGSHSVTWDGKDNSGNLVSSGVYYIMLNVGGYKNTMKTVLIK